MTSTSILKVRASRVWKVFFCLACFSAIVSLAQKPSLPPFDPGELETDSPWLSLGDHDAEGSTNVPIDSWVYPALERLANLGYIPTQNILIRPWTRQECLRQVREAMATVSTDEYRSSLDDEALRLIKDLRRELLPKSDGPRTELESVYVRYGQIMGPALTDGTHFGQTWRNDYGRPLGRGGSVIAGFAARANWKRFFLYGREEMQQDPGNPGVTPALSSLLNYLDTYASQPGPVNPHPVAPPVSASLRARPIELYAGFAFAGNQLSFGKQQIEWGPTDMGALSFSHNAEPTYNLRLVSARPHPVPFLEEWATYSFDVTFGKFSGRRFPARPYFNGQKFQINLVGVLEMGFTRWSVLWGEGHPMTLGSLKRNIFSSNSTGASFVYGERTDPGDRKSGFDFRLHVPGIAKYVTLYADSYADDELNPLDAPRRVAWSPGIYFPRLPYLPNVDLRAEVTSTGELSRDEGGYRFFINNQYLDANQNKGFPIGTAVTRDGRAYQVSSTWWYSPKTSVTALFRQSKGSAIFLPGGSTIVDGSLKGSYAITPEWMAQAFVQRERFLMPSFKAGEQFNTSAWFSITWTPKNSELKIRK